MQIHTQLGKLAQTLTESGKSRAFSGRCAGDFTHEQIDTFCQIPTTRPSRSESCDYVSLYKPLDECQKSRLGKAFALCQGEEHRANDFEIHEAVYRCFIGAASCVRAYATDPSSVSHLAAPLAAPGWRPYQPGDFESPALRRRTRVAFLATLPSSQNSSGPEASLPGLFC